MSYTDQTGPTTVAYTLSHASYHYMWRLIELGAVEGSKLGEMKLASDLEPVVDAMHQVLAGGAVEIKVTRKGNADIVNELKNRVNQSTVDGNAINKAAGYYVTAIP